MAEEQTGTLRVLVLGTGSIAETTCEALTEIDAAELVGMVSPRGEVSYDDCDVVAVCTPNGLHVEHALAAVAAGKHVVVEKPLTLDIASGQRLLDAAAEAGVTVSVVSQRRWEPEMVAAKEAVESGVLGQPLLGECLMRWRRKPEYYTERPWRGSSVLDGGVLFNQGIHLIDLLRWLLGPVETVDGAIATRVHAIESPDTATTLLRFVNGAQGIVSATTAADEAQPAELNLWFENGHIRVADDGLLAWQVPGVEQPRPEEPAESGSGDPAAIGAVGHRRQWAAILDALLSGAEPQVSGRDGLGTAALVAAIHESSRYGRVTPTLP